MGDSEDNEGYTTNAWFNETHSENNPIPGVFLYREYFSRKTAKRVDSYLRDQHLGLLYSAVKFIAGRMLSRVWHPSQGSSDIVNDPFVSARLRSQSINIMRVETVVNRLENWLKMTSNMGLNGDKRIRIEHIRNISEVDSAVIGLYAESAVCVKLAEEYYPDDDEGKWKPMVYEYMAILWTAHLYIQNNYTQREEDTDSESD
jgi:hypothetical protein